MNLKNKTLFIDLDGTMYRGEAEIKGATHFIKHLQAKHIPYIFLTNNAMRTHKQNRIKMEKMGFENIKDADFFTSSMAAASYTKRLYPDAKNAYYIGQEGLHEALCEQGFVVSDKDVDFVFIGLDMTATYQDYSNAFYHLQKGAKLIGTNPDRKLPHGDHFLVGNGAIVNMLEYASGQTALIVGKPNPPIMEEALSYANVKKEDCVIIGDNLETDIAFGIDNGVSTIFVTSGVHDEFDCERLNIHPDKIIHDLRELFFIL